MTETPHICCEHVTQAHADAERAWGAVTELQRRLLIISNAVRGTDRYLNGRAHLGRSVKRATVPTLPADPSAQMEGRHDLSQPNRGGRG